MPAKKEKLKLELVPMTMWDKNVRAVIAKDLWDELRWIFDATQEKLSYRRLNAGSKTYKPLLTCSICKTPAKELELHEVWSFDDKKRIQKLKNLIPICELCHFSMHLGRASQLGKGEEAKKHIAKVNKWTERQLQNHIDYAFDTWSKRSLYKYKLDLSWLQKRFPEINIHYDWLDSDIRRPKDKLGAMQWARELLISDVLILDTETTGLLKDKNAEIIELAIINMKGRVLYDSRFKPKYKIPKRTINIHGITNLAVKNSPKFKNEYESISKCLTGKHVIAYKSAFDSGMLSRTCKMHGMQPIDVKWDCAMWAYKYYMQSSKFLALPGSTHSAVDDCKAVLKLLKKMAKGR